MTEEYIDSTKMKIRVTGDHWSYGAAVTVAQLCNKYDLPFLDRAGVAFAFDEHVQIPNVVAFESGHKHPKGYIFFTHSNMPDEPFTHNSKAAVLELPVKKPEVTVNETTNTRKIVEGTKRQRLEFRELQAKCKAAGSFHEWLTALHDVLLVPQYTVARIVDGKVVWGVSPERAVFEWANESSLTDFVPKMVALELAALLKQASVSNKPPRVIKTERPLSNSSARAILIDAYCKERAIEVDEEDVWVLVIKPVTIENGLY